MIFESIYWRRELRRVIKVISKLKLQRRWTDATYGNFERAVMTGFYIVRKLLEAKLASDKLRATTWPLTQFPYVKGGLSHIIWPQVHDIYDLKHPARCGKATHLIAHQLIHSYVFTPSFDSSGLLTGIFFVSEKEAAQRVFWAPIDTIASIFGAVISRRGLAWRIGPEKNRITYP